MRISNPKTFPSRKVLKQTKEVIAFEVFAGSFKARRFPLVVFRSDKTLTEDSFKSVILEVLVCHP